MRTLPRALAPESPSAVSTCEGSSEPELQALPVEISMPARSRPTTTVSASMAIETHVDVVRQPRNPGAVTHGPVDARKNAIDQRVSQRRNPRTHNIHFLDREFEGNRKTNHARHVLGAGAAATLLTPSIDEWSERETLAGDKRANSFRTFEFVTREGERINAKRGDVDGNMAHGLHGVSVKEGATFVGQGGKSRNILQSSDFVVAVHDAHHGGCSIECSL